MTDKPSMNNFVIELTGSGNPLLRGFHGVEYVLSLDQVRQLRDEATRFLEHRNYQCTVCRKMFHKHEYSRHYSLCWPCFRDRK